MKTALKFNFKQIEHTEIEFIGEAPVAVFDISDEELVSFGPVKYDLKVHPVSGGALMTGFISLMTKRTCGRCLKRFDESLSVSDMSHFYERDENKEFDLIPDMREDILVALPLNSVCGKNCKGLCLVCGTDLNSGECGCENPSSFPNTDAWGKLDKLKISKPKPKGHKNGSSKKKKI
jgi:uncharacterized protein